jgi:hypothetical protein
MLLVVAMLSNVALAGDTASGSHTAKLTELGDKTAAYTVNNDHGAVSVTCSPSTSEATSTLSWNLKGPGADDVAKSLQASAKKDGTGGTFGVTAPKSLSTMDTKDLSLAVTLPLGATLNVVGGDGTVAVTACEGTVDVKNTTGDITVHAAASTLKVLAPKGNVDLRMANGSLTGASTIDAPIGNIAVSMPDFNANIDGLGQSIAVSMPDLVPTTQTATAIQGKVAKGGAVMTLKAPKGTLVLK